eukprot:7865592-Pyramimonas_sp.AAC.1
MVLMMMLMMMSASEVRANALAMYLESVQWAVRPACLMDRPDLFEELPVERAMISRRKLKDAACSLSDGKAVGPDELPVEFWNIVL